MYTPSPEVRQNDQQLLIPTATDTLIFRHDLSTILSKAKTEAAELKHIYVFLLHHIHN